MLIDLRAFVHQQIQEQLYMQPSIFYQRIGGSIRAHFKSYSCQMFDYQTKIIFSFISTQ